MNELIKVTYQNNEPAVSARELHDFLEVGTPYQIWFPRMCEYGFTEGEDYYSILSNRSDGRPGKPRQDAVLTLDTAKEICMLQRKEKGRQARRYFIQLEKSWNSPEKVMARALMLAMQYTGESLPQQRSCFATPQLSHAPAPKLSPMLTEGKPRPIVRSIPKAVEYIRQRDPDSCISICVLRRWVKEGKVPAVKTGKNFLVNMDDLERFLAKR